MFGLLPDACSSENSDTELEHKDGLQQIEEERKLRHQQQYEHYRNFLEEQKHQFYLQQEAQLFQEHEHTNGYIQEQCNQNGSFPTCSSGYVQKQQYIKDGPLENHSLVGCIQEQCNQNGGFPTCSSGYVQKQQYAQDEPLENRNLVGCIQEQCNQNGGFPTCSSGYVQKQQYIQDEPLENHNLVGCIQEQETYNPSGYIQQHETYQLQSQDNQEYQFAVDTNQCHNQQDQYQFAAQQYVDELQYLAEAGCPVLSEQSYRADVPVRQPQPVGQEEADEGGRLFCVIGPTGSTCAAMSTLVGASEGEY
jgi:hypothetical protein